MTRSLREIYPRLWQNTTHAVMAAGVLTVRVDHGTDLLVSPQVYAPVRWHTPAAH